MFPDVPVRKKTRIQNILKDIGINSLEELGYEEREKYLREIGKLKGNLLQKSYLEELDAMKLASIKWAAEGKSSIGLEREVFGAEVLSALFPSI